MSQRWRLTVARGPGAMHLQHRDLTPTWETILVDVAAAAAESSARPAGEPSGQADEREAGRPRVVTAAPLPSGMTASAELIDLVLPVGRLPRARLRAIVEPRLPVDHALVDAIDVWVGEPSLPSLVVAAAYTVDVSADRSDPPVTTLGSVDGAIADLLAQSSIPRARGAPRGAAGRDPARAPANLRPLIERLVAEPSGAPDAVARLHMILRVDPALGSGRPEEIVEALGRHGLALEIRRAHRDGFKLRVPARRPPRLTVSGPRPTLTRRARDRSQ